ncbi:hypothetical protein ACIRL0_01195 [Streptomyces sp. NPDC102365]|uniref:hypothetical protein n=1 Tax=Streptomyces sp. NPDC102365 TaxID=3366162 RepID=UPI0037F8CD10
MPNSVNGDSGSDDERKPAEHEETVLGKRSLNASALTAEPLAKKANVLEEKALRHSPKDEEREEKGRERDREREPLSRKVRAAVSRLARTMYDKAGMKPDETSLSYLAGDDEEFWSSLGIEYDVGDMYEQMEKAGGVRLRSTGDPFITKLVIGCGNHPYEYKAMGEDSKHAHKDAYTVDKSVSMSPTVLGAFGYTNLAPLFLPGVFEQIIFEGYSPVDSAATLDRQPYLLADLVTLLADDGKLALPVGPNQNVRTVVARKKQGRIEVMAVLKGDQPPAVEAAGTEVTENYLKSLVPKAPG